MKKVWMFLTVIALAGVVASPAVAYRGVQAGYGSGPGNIVDIGAARELDLTAEQKEKLNNLREEHLKEIKPIQDQLQSKRGELRNLWLAKTPDQEKILAFQKEVRSLRDRLADKFATHRLEAQKILTPEQLAKVQSSYGMGRGMARGRAGMMGGHAYGRGMR